MTLYEVICNGKTYIMKKPLTVGEVQAIWKGMEEHMKLFVEGQKDPQKYLQFVKSERQQWQMVTATLKKCLNLTDEELSSMSYLEARSLFSSILTFSAKITKVQ